MSQQTEFTASLVQITSACPDGLCSWNGSDPAQRFAIYRNNHIVSLVDALADTFPVTQALVGEEFFRAMASLYARAEPPRSAVMAWYGGSFPAFVQDFAPAASLQYLADLARLELLYVESFHAADATPLSVTELAGLLQDEGALAHVRLQLHPSIRVLRSSYAVVSLWAAHQQESPASALGAINPDLAEAAIVIRQALAVEIIQVDAGTADFIGNLLRGDAFATALSTALPFNLNGALDLLIRTGAIIQYNVQE